MQTYFFSVYLKDGLFNILFPRVFDSGVIMMFDFLNVTDGIGQLYYFSGA